MPYIQTIPRLPAIFDWSFGWGLRNSNGRGRSESGMVPFERALVSSHSNFSSIVTRFNDQLTDKSATKCSLDARLSAAYLSKISVSF